MELGLAMKEEHGLSLHRACRVLGLSTSAPYYRPRGRDDTPVIEAVSKHVTDNPGHGFGLLYDSFRADRQPWGKSWLWRVYKQLRLNLPRRQAPTAGPDRSAARHSRASERNLVGGLHGGCALERPALPHVQRH